MGAKLYKYVSSDYLTKVLSSDGVYFKCSYPKDFNDPFELFLTIDFNEEPQALAFYQDTIGNIPQLPTTCFSKSPSVTPMWAHYAKNLEGFVLELDEDELSNHFSDSAFGDVDYSDEPKEELTEMLYRAFTTKKSRHTYLLRNAVFSAAYYTKTTCWRYELERRMVVSELESTIDGNLILLNVPADSITAIIAGPRASKDTVTELKAQSAKIGVQYFEMQIGKSSCIPFFFDSSGAAHIFDGSVIARSQNVCSKCREPLYEIKKNCSWCQINDSHRLNAALSNPYRILDRVGSLESYVRQMDQITSSYRKGDV